LASTILDKRKSQLNWVNFFFQPNPNLFQTQLEYQSLKQAQSWFLAMQEITHVKSPSCDPTHTRIQLRLLRHSNEKDDWRRNPGRN